LVVVEADEGASAKTLERPALQRALAMLREHQADALLVPKLDRLTRRVVDLGLLIETYFAEGRWALVSVADQIDTRTAAGRMTLFILMSVAQWEREAIGERTADALAHLRAEGVVLGRAAFGWRHSEVADPATGRRLLGAVDVHADAIDRIRALRAEGKSFAAIARQMADDGRPTQRGGRWLPNTVRRIWRRCAVVPHAASAEASSPEGAEWRPL
jgi:DNA invertase Pin-like site-specific DNA recombinase